MADKTNRTNVVLPARLHTSFLQHLFSLLCLQNHPRVNPMTKEKHYIIRVHKSLIIKAYIISKFLD
jgi:hypothetical protein